MTEFDFFEESDVEWVCPECKATAPCRDWKEVEPGCETCGNHYGRECPNPECKEWFDSIWDEDALEKAQIAG